ncbi:MAG: hypothetical protein ABFD63_05640 [Smithella sp.]
MSSEAIPGEVYYVFDTRYPLIPQLERAKKNLLALQKEQKGGGKRDNIKLRRDYDGWILLLRALDAIAAGATDGEIAEVLIPQPTIDAEVYYEMKKVHGLKNRPPKYITTEYRFIPFSDK